MTDRELTPREARDRYINHRKTEASESSLKSYRYRLKHFVEWAEESPEIETMDNLNGWLLDEYENHRRGGGISVVTLNSEMQTLLNWLEYLARIEVIGDDLPEKVHVPEVPKEAETNDEMLEAGEASAFLSMFREDTQRYGSSKHALLELLWFVGCRVGAVRALDLEDYSGDEQMVVFRHRPETNTPLKNDVDGERAVGLSDTVCDVLDAYIRTNRMDIHDDSGREPLFATREGRPATNTLRVWTYLATQPCLHEDCPHGNERGSCEFVHVHHASKCPSSVSPHRVRTGSITWQRDCGLPAEAVAERVNASLEVIEKYYDKATERERLERRRRPYLDNLTLQPDP